MVLLSFLLAGQGLAAVATVHSRPTVQASRALEAALAKGDLGAARAAAASVAEKASGRIRCAQSHYLSANSALYFPRGEARRFAFKANGRLTFARLQGGTLTVLAQLPALGTALPSDRGLLDQASLNRQARAGGCGTPFALPPGSPYYSRDFMPPAPSYGAIVPGGLQVVWQSNGDDWAAFFKQHGEYPPLPGEVIRR